MSLKKATFGGGCFWKIEDSFLPLQGVICTSVGYMGGHFPHPSYLDVLSRITGHAEVAQIEFNSSEISYEELLDIFWSIHDPTQLNRQGADRGEQYRSVIFYHYPEQEKIARQSKHKQENSHQYSQPIVTQIKPACDYYLADQYHQQYLLKQRMKKKVI